MMFILLVRVSAALRVYLERSSLVAVSLAHLLKIMTQIWLYFLVALKL